MADYGIELSDVFVSVLESGLFNIELDFKWCKLSEYLVKLLIENSKCLELVSKIRVYEYSGKVESMLFNAKWKQLSDLRFEKIAKQLSDRRFEKIVVVKKKKEMQTLDFTKMEKLEVLHMRNVRFENPFRKNLVFNMRELKLDGQNSSFFTKLFKFSFPKLESLEITNCDLRKFKFSTNQSFKLKYLNLSKSILSGDQFIELLQDEKLQNLENLSITLLGEEIDQYLIYLIKNLFENSVFCKTLSSISISLNMSNSYFSIPKVLLGDLIRDLRNNGRLQNIKELNILGFEKFPILKSYTISETDCFQNLTYLKFQSTLDRHEFNLMNLKHLLVTGDGYLKLNLPNLETLECSGGFEFEPNSTNNLKHVSIIVNDDNIKSLTSTSMKLETLSLYADSYCDYDDFYTIFYVDFNLEKLISHPNVANLKELYLRNISDEHVKILANSQLRLNSLIIESNRLDDYVFDICNGSIETKHIQLTFHHESSQDPIKYSGSLNGLVEFLHDLETQEYNANLFSTVIIFQDYYYLYSKFVNQKYDEVLDVFGRNIVSELTFKSRRRRFKKSEKKDKNLSIKY